MSERNKITVRRWRRGFLAFYLAFTIGAILLTFISIVAYHCGGRPAPQRGVQIPKNPSHDDLNECCQDLQLLLTDLHQEAFAIQAKALRLDTDPSAEWRNWSEDWRLRWQSLDWRCRLTELSRAGANPIVEQMAAVHQALDTLNHSYSDVVAQFVDKYVHRLHRLRRELASVRSKINRKRPLPRGARDVSNGANSDS